MQLHLSSSNSSSDISLDDCHTMSSIDAPSVNSRVPFKWEETPGRPITAKNMPFSCSDMISYDHTDLQLPPKLQFPGHRSPLLLEQQSPYENPSCSPLCPSRVSPHRPKHRRLYTCMLKTASWSQPFHTLIHRSPLWHRSPCASISDGKNDKVSSNERFFFDKASPKLLKCSVSMDSWKLQFPIHEEYKQHDAFVHSQSLSCLAMEEHEAVSTASSPWHPILFHETEGSESPCQTTSIRVFKELGKDGEENDEGSPCQLSKTIKACKELKRGDEEDDEGFDDFFSTTCSLGRHSQRSDESMVPLYSLPSPWLLAFGPKEDKVHEAEKGGSKKPVVRLVTLVKLKKIISSNICKLRQRRRGADQQANYTSIWSPTLATYLHNQQKEERESSTASLEYIPSEDDDDDDELTSSSSGASSHRFQINPNYHLPGSILKGHLHTNDDLLEGEGSGSFTEHQLGLGGRPCFPNMEEEPHKVRHRLSLREQLAGSPLQSLTSTQNRTPQIFDSKRREPTQCKRMCKVQRTVKILVATIKLILIRSDNGKGKGQQTPSLKNDDYSSPVPTIGTLTPFPST